MKNRKLSYIMIGFVSAMIVSLGFGLAIFLPRFTKADNTNLANTEIKETMEATITGANSAPASEKGGAVFLEGIDGEETIFTMTGGEISGHNKLYGGAVYIANKATFVMEDGIICNNQAKYGGAIYVEKGGTCIISGGKIMCNSAEVSPAIHVEPGASLIIENPSVLGHNYTVNYGNYIYYYVDGVLNSMVGIDSSYVDTMFYTSAEAPLDYENCPGYFLDEELTYGIEDGNIIFSQDVSEVKTLTEESSVPELKFNSDGVLKLYTKEATLDKLEFIPSENATELVSGLPESNGPYVVPKNHNGLPVELASEAFNAAYTCGGGSVTIPYSIEVIAGGAFGYNTTDINWHNNIKAIEGFAFSDCMADSLKLPESVEKIGTGAFWHFYAEELIIPKNVTEIGVDVFSESTINNIVFECPLTITASMIDSVENQNIKTITIGGDVLGVSGFNATLFPNLKTLNVGVKNVTTDITGGFTKSMITTVNILEGVETIGLNSFYQWSKVTAIELPSSLTLIGENAIRDCDSLASINIEETSVTEIGGRALASSGILDTIKLPNTLKIINNRAFQACVKLKGVFEIPSSVEYIGQYAFDNCYEIEELIINEGVKSIDAFAFKNLRDLKKAYIPSSLETVGNSIFYTDAQYVQNAGIYVELDQKKSTGWHNSWKNNANFIVYNCSFEDYNNLEKDMIITNGVLTSYNGTRKKVVVPITVTEISANAFKSSSLEEIVLPTTVTSIKANAFKDCVNLSSVKFMHNSALPTIESNAFSGSILKTISTYSETLTNLIKSAEWIPTEYDRKLFHISDWESIVDEKIVTISRDYGNGTQEKPYLLSDIEDYIYMIEKYASLQSTKFYSSNNKEVLEAVATKKIEDYGSIKVIYTGSVDNWKQSSFETNKIYFKLYNDIDFREMTEAVYGTYASISIDGNGHYFKEIDGELFENTPNYGALIENGVDIEFKNLIVTLKNRMATLCAYIRGGINIFDDVTIAPNENNDYIHVENGDKNESVYMSCMFDGTVKFLNCKNYANYMSSCGYFGIFMGGYARYRDDVGIDSRVYFENCVNNGNIITTGMAAVFFGNGTRRPAYFELKNCVNNGYIKGAEGCHVLATHTTGNEEFFKGDYVGFVERYNSNVLGELNQNGKVELLTSNINASISEDGDLTLSSKSGKLKVGRYQITIQSIMSFKPNDASNNSWNIPIIYNINIEDLSSYTLENCVYRFIDRKAYEEMGYTYSGEWIDAEEYNYVLDTVNGYYVFDFPNDFWYMPPKYYDKGVKCTITVFDENDNIIDFALTTVVYEEEK